MVGNRQLGGIFSYGSGTCLSISDSTSRVLLEDFPKSSGKVTFDSTGVLYFEGLKQVPDPGSAALYSNPPGGSNCSTTKPGQFSKLAIADSQDRMIIRILLPEYLALLAWPGSRRGAARCPTGFEFRQADKNNRKYRFSVARGWNFESSQF